MVRVGQRNSYSSLFSATHRGEWTDCDTGTHPLFLVICACGVDYIAESEMYLTFVWKGGTFLTTLVIWPQLSRQFRTLEQYSVRAEFLLSFNTAVNGPLSSSSVKPFLLKTKLSYC